MIKKITKFALPQELIYKLHRFASEKGVTVSEAVEEIIREKVKKETEKLAEN